MTIQRDTIEITSADGSFTAYLATPNVPTNLAIVILQEIFGVNSNIRAIADQFAELGYVAVAPDLYWRHAPKIELDPGSPEGRAKAMEMMKSLNRDEAVADGEAALATVRQGISGLSHAAAIGYSAGSGSVRVTASLSFSGSPLTLNANTFGNLTLNLIGGKAPAGGLKVNLSSSNISVATVPSTVTFTAHLLLKSSTPSIS